MPFLQFSLSNPQLTLRASEGRFTRTLYFDAMWSRDATLTLLTKDEQFECRRVICRAFVFERTDENAVPPKKLDGSARDESDVVCPGYLIFTPQRRPAQGGNTSAGSDSGEISIEFTLSRELFSTLLYSTARDSLTSIRLDIPWKGSIQDKQTISFGNAPDGSELEWNVELWQEVFAKQIDLSISPRPSENSLPDEEGGSTMAREELRTALFKLQTPLTKPDNAEIMLGIEQVFWAIVVAAGLLLVVVLLFVFAIFRM